VLFERLCRQSDDGRPVEMVVTPVTVGESRRRERTVAIAPEMA
jgi:hypothetical protein